MKGKSKTEELKPQQLDLEGLELLGVTAGSISGYSSYDFYKWLEKNPDTNFTKQYNAASAEEATSLMYKWYTFVQNMKNAKKVRLNDEDIQKLAEEVFKNPILLKKYKELSEEHPNKLVSNLSPLFIGEFSKYNRGYVHTNMPVCFKNVYQKKIKELDSVTNSQSKKTIASTKQERYIKDKVSKVHRSTVNTVESIKVETARDSDKNTNRLDISRKQEKNNDDNTKSRIPMMLVAQIKNLWYTILHYIALGTTVSTVSWTANCAVNQSQMLSEKNIEKKTAKKSMVQSLIESRKNNEKGYTLNK